MTTRWTIIRTGLVALCLTLLAAMPWPTPSVAATTNTAQILAKTTAALPRCLRWRLTGICLWLRCGIRGCRVRVSPRVFNYAPDAVVTTHNEPALHPWVEARPILATANAGLAGLVGGFADASGSVEGRREHVAPGIQWPIADLFEPGNQGRWVERFNRYDLAPDQRIECRYEVGHQRDRARWAD